jgi:hypothetical protein
LAYSTSTVCRFVPHYMCDSRMSKWQLVIGDNHNTNLTDHGFLTQVEFIMRKSIDLKLKINSRYFTVEVR